jgi:hypothetical protein
MVVAKIKRWWWRWKGRTVSGEIYKNLPALTIIL